MIAAQRLAVSNRAGRGLCRPDLFDDIGQWPMRLHRLRASHGLNRGALWHLAPGADALELLPNPLKSDLGEAVVLQDLAQTAEHPQVVAGGCEQLDFERVLWFIGLASVTEDKVGETGGPALLLAVTAYTLRRGGPAARTKPMSFCPGRLSARAPSRGTSNGTRHCAAGRKSVTTHAEIAPMGPRIPWVSESHRGVCLRAPPRRWWSRAVVAMFACGSRARSGPHRRGRRGRAGVPQRVRRDALGDRGTARCTSDNPVDGLRGERSLQGMARAHRRVRNAGRSARGVGVRYSAHQ